MKIQPTGLALIISVYPCLMAIGCDTSEPRGRYNPTTIIMVRHAEKATGSTDPPLATEGRKRAKELVFMLEDVPLDAIYSTSFKRTLETAQAVSDDKGLDTVVYDADVPLDLFSEILETYPGGSVLIIGHSNSIPAMANLLADSKDFSLCGTYDHMLVASVFKIGKAKVTTLKYRQAVSR